MKKIKFINYTICALLLLTCSCAEKGIELKFNYQVGQDAKYRLISEINTRTTTRDKTNNYSIRIDMVVNYQIEKILENGDAEMVFTYEKITYLNTQNPENSDKVIDQLKKLKIRLTISPYGEIIDAQGYEDIPNIYAEDFNIFTFLLKAHPIFPRAKIPVGRPWDRQQEYPIENGLVKGNMLVYKRFSVEDTSCQEGGCIAKIGSEITMKFDVPDQDDFTIEQDGEERMGLFGKGTINFDYKKGEAISTNAAIFGKMLVTIKHPVTGKRISTKVEVVQNIIINKTS